MKSSMKLQYAESFQMQMPSVFVCMYNLVEVNKKITQILTANLKTKFTFCLLISLIHFQNKVLILFNISIL